MHWNPSIVDSTIEVPLYKKVLSLFKKPATSQQKIIKANQFFQRPLEISANMQWLQYFGSCQI